MGKISSIEIVNEASTRRKISLHSVKVKV